MEGQADRPPRRFRIGTVMVVALIHVGIGIGLVRMFAPDLTVAIIDRVVETYTVITTTPPPEPEVKEKPKGAAAEEAPKAAPREVSSPRQTLPKRPEPVPPVSATGKDNASGAAAAGKGTGGGGEGTGTGSGKGGTGQGGMAARGVEKVAGEINSANDYRKKTRDLRIGQSVTILLTVGTDGRISDCRVSVPSPDPEADTTTCRLARDRFRFRPALDRNGNPVVGKYAWRQRWFY